MFTSLEKSLLDVPAGTKCKASRRRFFFPHITTTSGKISYFDPNREFLVSDFVESDDPDRFDVQIILEGESVIVPWECAIEFIEFETYE